MVAHVPHRSGSARLATFGRGIATYFSMTKGSLWIWLSAGFGVACSAPPSDGAPEFGPTAPSASTGTPNPQQTSTANEPDGTNASSANPGTPNFGFVEPEEEVVLELDNSCGGSVFEPEQLPLDMYFLVDSSGSMAEPTAAGANKWDLVTSALVNFLSNPENAQIGVGIGYFPQGVQATCVAGDPGCLCIPFINLCLPNLGGSCLPADYASPSVALTLPSDPTRLIADIRLRAFAGGTPTRAALEGTYQYLSTWTSQNPGRKVVAVLATDGDPTGCAGNSPAEVANLAASALASPNPIQTFVIGVGRSLANLNQVAKAGGTTQAFLTDTSSDLASEFAEALAAIRTLAGPCAFEIPGETDQGAVDPSFVNVRFTPNGATQPTVVAKTFSGTAAECGSAGGWHYDNPNAPTRIQLCEASCKAAFNSRMEVLFGCETIVQPPR
jgi:hypothetical protein